MQLFWLADKYHGVLITYSDSAWFLVSSKGADFVGLVDLLPCVSCKCMMLCVDGGLLLFLPTGDTEG